LDALVVLNIQAAKAIQAVSREVQAAVRINNPVWRIVDFAHKSTIRHTQVLVQHFDPAAAARPDPKLTPGDVFTDATAEDI
jgi:hypothetical protein